MRKLVVGTFVTLDGVMQAPGGPNEDRDGGFLHGGWLVPYFDMTEWTKRAGAFLLGRKTYEIFAGSWPKSTDPADEIATALNTRQKLVASRTLDIVKWSNSILLKGDVAEEVAKLKAQEGGEIQVHGSSDLLQTLLRHDLIDTLRIWQFPVVIGTGKRLFGGGTIPASFRLVDTQMATTGAVLHVYERAGGLRYGEVEVGQETVIFDSDAAHKRFPCGRTEKSRALALVHSWAWSTWRASVRRAGYLDRRPHKHRSAMHPSAAIVTFRPLHEDDIPLLHDWLHRPHIIEWWGGNDAAPSVIKTREKYLPRIFDGTGVSAYIALAENRPIGFAQSYVALGVGGGWWEEETDPGVRGIDQFLCDGNSLGQGLGTRMVTAFVSMLFSQPGVTRVQTDPLPNNARAIRCYEKSGFRRLRNVVTPDGPALLMVHDIPLSQVSPRVA